MILSFILSIACVITGMVSVLAVAALLSLRNCFASIAERWLVGMGVFVLIVNLNFGLLSLLPIDRPLRLLALPLHFSLLAVVLYLVGGKGLRAALAETINDVYRMLRNLHKVWYPILFVFVVLMLVYAIQGIFTVPGGVDELSYHVPQAVGMIQEGRIRFFDVPPTWILHYPQGAASLWAWTMLFTGGDQLFRLVQIGFGLQLLLATGLLAWRNGADNISTLLAVLTVVAMPIYYVLITTVGADLGYAAAVMSFLAFLAPPRTKQFNNSPLHDFLVAGLFLAQAAAIKIPVTALIYFAFAGCAFLWGRVGLANAGVFLRRAIFLPMTWIVLLLVGMSFSFYILNWMETSNPMFPLTLRVGGVVLFKGVIGPIEDIVMGHSTFGPVSEMNYFQRWYAVFADWFQPMNQDAFGGPGPIFILVTLFMAALGIFDRLRRPSAWSVALVLMVGTVFLIPASYLPRYNLAWLCLLSVAASLAYTKIRRLIPSLPFVIVAILLIGIFAQVREIHNTFIWVKQMSAPEPWYINRGRSIVEKIDIDRRLAPTAEMLRTIRDNIMKGDTLSYSVHVYATLMWNREYSNIIQFIPINGNPNTQPLVVSIQNQSSWLSRIKNSDPDWVLVYSASGLARLLLDQKTVRGYTLFFADAKTGNKDKDRWNMTLLHRTK